MDIGSAFTYVFDDENWVKKVAIGGLAMLFSVIIVPVFLVVGYMLQTLKNVRDNHPKPLPEWDDFGGLMIKGLMVSLIGLVYSIPVILLYCLVMGAQIGIQNADSDAAGPLAIVAGCLVCLVLLVGLLINLVVPAAIIRYAQQDSFGAAFQLGEIFQLIRNNPGNYIIAILLTMVAGMLSYFGVLLCFVGLYFTIFWAILVQAHLYGQLARKAQA